MLIVTFHKRTFKKQYSMKYISCYRVNSIKQGNPRLGLDAQESAVSKFLKSNDVLIAKCKEIESLLCHSKKIFNEQS